MSSFKSIAVVYLKKLGGILPQPREQLRGQLE